ncbi:hypothetical protein [Streptomyces sp. BK340]|uniref:hypothetical protein n=1 Tax=Streptomyces sp. BK340 TaxID=2572903 RepID=UPI0011A8E5FE|nr:hypothetical protein [Streptomyces sp. BK340]TVZ96473.1 hypothetical protein FB157_103384 [Streptomyces sp. BK340]
MTNILTASESSALAEHEAVIERGIKTFYEVGTALADIRDRKLYRADHGTFEEYCQRRWQLSRPRAYELITAAEVVSGMPDTAQPVANARQASELARVPEPERADVWRETVERTAGKPTAAAVRETYEQRQEPDLLAGDDWVQPDGPGFQAAVTPPTAAPRPKRRPLTEALAEASRDYTRAAERLARLTEDDRFPKNRDTTHHQVPELLGALDHTTHLIQAMHLDQADTSEEARRWWATSLHKISDALADVANTLETEMQ